MARPVFLSLVIAPLGLAQDTPGLQFLGYGYDALRGNPLATSGLGDIGFRTNVFELQHKQGLRTPDNKWSVPDKTTAQALSSCSLDQKTRIINSAYEYEKTVSDSVDITGEYKGVQGGFNSQSKNVNQRTQHRQSIFAHVTSLCSVYKLTMHTFDHPPLDPNFKKGVEFLPLKYDESAYMEFLKVFGTHVVTDMTLGGRWGWQSEFKLDDWQTMTNYNIDIAASLSYAGKAKAGLKVDHSVDQKVQAHVTKSISSNSSFNLGGDYYPDVQRWQASVAAKPMPIQTTLKKLSELLTNQYFPTRDKAADLLTKQKNLETALDNYCGYLQRTLDSSVSCVAPKPIPLPVPKPVNTVRGLCMENGGGYVMTFDMFADKTPKSTNSGNFPIGQTRCIDAEELDAQENNVLKCRIHIVLGVTRDCPGDGYRFSWFSKLKSHYKCWGTTLFPHCEFQGLSQHDGQMVYNATEAVALGFSDGFSSLLSSDAGTYDRVAQLVTEAENLIV